MTASLELVDDFNLTSDMPVSLRDVLFRESKMLFYKPTLHHRTVTLSRSEPSQTYWDRRKGNS
ncbi:protein of unknown function [Bradyrhizobium sp. ORS 285]|uniref:hypothetical protein n=1 Tax=Bradyrhizobium sp. ORS 285 TaxID=115808 RepID=UPI0002407E6C|nr:hypothetical protein [Bradyrhizobium sp. ORS 285]CCD86214.1 hypothetical protein BRAO285_180023 [Bradyrhizobium sp. ORS 285]SMX61019.1 protein of unknown function [Bradyrhizobium sp. ORS 285]